MSSPWIIHVKQYALKNNKSYKESLKLARASYTPDKKPKKQKGGAVGTIFLDFDDIKELSKMKSGKGVGDDVKNKLVEVVHKGKKYVIPVSMAIVLFGLSTLVRGPTNTLVFDTF